MDRYMTALYWKEGSLLDRRSTRLLAPILWWASRYYVEWAAGSIDRYCTADSAPIELN